MIGVVNGKSETRRDTKIGILKSEPEMKKHNDFIEIKTNMTDGHKI